MSLVTTLRNKFFTIGAHPDVSGSWNWQLYGETNYGEGMPFTHFKIDNNKVIYGDPFDGDIIVYTQYGGWTESSYRYIYIGEGADVDNSDAINWFQINATEYIPTYNLSYNMSHLTITDYGGGQAPATVQYDGSVDLKLHPDVDYGLPSSIIVNGNCNYTYRSSDGAIFIENIRSNISISATGTFHKTYNITTNLNHLAYIGDNTVETDGEAFGTLYAATGYFLPETITVTGCLYEYNKNTGIIRFYNPPHNSEGVTLTAEGSEIDTSDLTLILYHNTSERNRLLKTITLIATEIGTLREKSSMLKPSILMEYDKVPDFNYVQIPNFKRYYYVDEIVSEGTNRWRIEMSVDVLMSFSLSILELQAFVNRNEFDYNSLIVDDRMPSTAQDIKEIIPCYQPEYTCDFQITHNYAYILSVTTDITHHDSINQNIIWETGSWDNTKIRKGFLSNCKILLDANNVERFVEGMNKTSFYDCVKNIFGNEPIEGIISLKAYPLNLDDKLHATSEPLGLIKIGNYELSQAGAFGKYVTSKCDKYAGGIMGGSFNFNPLSPSYTWEDFKAQYDLYIPFYGFITLDFNEIYLKELFLNYIIDFDTGNCTIVIYVTNPTRIIRTLSSKIGIDIPLSQSNSIQIARDIGQMVLNSYASAMATSIGIGSGNPLALAGGVVSGVKTASQIFDIHKKVSRIGATGGAYEGSYMSLEPYIIKTTPDYYTPTNYAHLFGFPLNETRTLKNIHGYTEVGEVHLENISGAMIDETRQIGEALGNGVILP